MAGGLTYRQIKGILKDAGIADPEDEARILIGSFCGVGAAEIMMSPDRAYDSPELAAATEKRRGRYPLQYIIGEWEFCGIRLSVNANCLIPRYDTEILVAEAVKRLPRTAVFADLCTGSGCIAIAVLKTLTESTAYALELYPETLALAKSNALRCGENVSNRFIPVCADVTDGKLPTEYSTLDAVISNPPYIPRADIETLEAELKYEPHAALDGGEDGMDFYRSIIPGYSRYLKPDGFFAFEIGDGEGEAITGIARENGFMCRIIKDIDGHERVAVLTRIMDNKL